jgi:hypothetical protein
LDPKYKSPGSCIRVKLIFIGKASCCFNFVLAVVSLILIVP